MAGGTSTDYGALFRETGQLYFKANNIVPLLVGSVILGVGTVLTLGILGPALMLGYTEMALRIARGENVGIGDIGSGMSRFGAALVLGILMCLGILLGLIGLVIGALVVAFLFTFAFQVMATDPKAGATDALKASVGLVTANVGDVVVLWVVAIVANGLLGATVIGGIISASFCALLFCVYYAKKAAQAGLTAGAAH